MRSPSEPEERAISYRRFSIVTDKNCHVTTHFAHERILYKPDTHTLFTLYIYIDTIKRIIHNKTVSLSFRLHLSLPFEPFLRADIRRAKVRLFQIIC